MYAHDIKSLAVSALENGNNHFAYRCMETLSYLGCNSAKLQAREMVTSVFEGIIHIGRVSRNLKYWVLLVTLFNTSREPCRRVFRSYRYVVSFGYQRRWFFLYERICRTSLLKVKRCSMYTRTKGRASSQGFG